MEAYLKKLERAGLTGNEARVYLELLRNGKLSANEIAKQIGMDRTLAYTVLNHLIEKGMIGYIIESGKKLFHAESPSNLLNPIREKEALIKDLSKELAEIQTSEKSDYEVNVYEGKEGLRTLMRKIIEQKSFCSFGATGRAYDLLYELQAITKELGKKKGFFARIIMSPKYRGHEFTKHDIIKTRFLDIRYEASTTIFGDYVSIHLIKDKPLIILIKNKDIAETYRNHFEVLWKIAKP
jgi:sugar-specific transcriptional regulator TrmB